MREIRKNCFAYNPETRKCTALNQLYCAFQNCPFYKPEKQPPEEANQRVRHTTY